MIIFVHVSCGEPAIETPDVVFPGVPPAFPFTCLNCLEEIDDESELKIVESTSQ